jgi:hypothetical protein
MLLIDEEREPACQPSWPSCSSWIRNANVFGMARILLS